MLFYSISCTLVVMKMNKTSSYEENMKQTYGNLFSSAFVQKARLHLTAFTRERDLPLPFLCAIILRGIKQALQLEIDDFFKDYPEWVTPVSKQAFSKARANLNPNAIKDLFLMVTRNMCKVKDLVFHGRYRLCAIDGASVALYNSPDLKDTYGTAGGSDKAVSALMSIAFDPLNNIVLDGNLNSSGTNERICAKEHIENITKLPLKFRIKNLFIMDRGYPSREFISWLLAKKHKFIIRVKRGFNLDFDSVNLDEYVSFVWNNRNYRVRILKIKLVTGEIETLVTNLDKRDLPCDDAGELYFKRWGIETKFNSLKNKMELENMSGRRAITVQQDFWATLYMANMFASAEWQTNAIIEERTTGSSNKYEQTTNENRLISKAREAFLHCLLETDPAKREYLFFRLFEDIARRPVEVKPNRSSKRSTPRKMRFHDTYKSVT